MLTETDARRLLSQAADTIEVDPAGPLPVPARRPWWPALPAVAAVAAVVAGVALIPWTDESAPAPTPPPATEAPPRGRPSVFGYSGSDAALMLRDRGYVVDVRVAPACEITGRAMGVRWGRDDRVTVLESGGSATLDCVDPVDPARVDAWELIDLLGGRDSTLDLAPTLRAYDGPIATTLRRDELASWAPLLAWSRAAPTRRPVLETSRSARGACDVAPPAARADEVGLVARVSGRADGATLGCRAVILYRDDGGPVVAIQVVENDGT